MNNLTENIIWAEVAKILHQLGKFNLEGLGILTAARVSAHLDYASGKFVPEHMGVTFLESDVMFDESQISELAKILKSNRSEISSLLSQNIARLKEQLTQQNQVEIPLFGTFKGKEGFIVFKPSESLLFITDSFGLTPIHLKAGRVEPKLTLPPVEKKVSLTEPVSVTVSPEIKETKAEAPVKRITIEQVEKESTERHESADALRQSALTQLKELLEQAQISAPKETKKHINSFAMVATVLTIILLVNVVIFLNKNPLKPISDEISKVNMGGTVSESLEVAVSEPKASEANYSNSSQIVEEASNENNYAAVLKSFEGLNFAKAPYAISLQSELSAIENTASIDDLAQTEVKEEHTNSEIENVESIAASKEIGSNKTTVIEDVPLLIARAEVNQVNPGYYVIAGVFGVEANGAKLVKELHKQGIKSAKLFKPLRYKYHLVMFNYFTDKTKAYEAQAQYANINSEAWIYEAR